LLLVAIDISEYRWLADKEHVHQIKESVRIFAAMPAFKGWKNSKLTNFCSNMKVKWYDKNSIVMP
jgi:hypothetical protein